MTYPVLTLQVGPTLNFRLVLGRGQRSVNRLRHFFFTITRTDRAFTFSRQLAIHILSITRRAQHVTRNNGKFANLMSHFSRHSQILVFDRVPRQAVTTQVRRNIRVFDLSTTRRSHQDRYKLHHQVLTGTLNNNNLHIQLITFQIRQ